MAGKWPAEVCSRPCMEAAQPPTLPGPAHTANGLQRNVTTHLVTDRDAKQW